MAYQSLYRRHRPLTFADITGQEHITRTLSNALSSGRLAHAYLFSGPRGTGKTTVAKILARTMNCDHYPAPEPCSNCRPCSNISTGVSIDVIEMDAASNRGIDEIRELRERTRYASAESRFKVYIIDEAHMLTTEACNAFLKTLEEPPRDVVFVLATTDPSRLPSTIVSRCQRFDFHLLTVDQIHQRLKYVLEQENWESDPEAVWLIARLADGSLRDALGILEQCSAYAEAQITAEHVRIVTGATRTETIDELIKAVIDNDPANGFEVLKQIIYSGRDLQLLLRDLNFVFSRLLLSAGEAKNQQGVDEHYGLESLADKYRGQIPGQILLEIVELMHEVRGELRHAHFPQYILEVAFIRLIRLMHGRIKTAPISQPGREDFTIDDPGVDNKGAEDERQSGFHKSANAKTQAEPHVSHSDGYRADGRAGDPQMSEAKANPASGSAKHQKIAASENKGAEAKEKTAAAKAVDSSFKESISEEEFNKETENAESKLKKIKAAWPKILEQLKKKQKSTAAWLEPAEVEDFRGELICLSYKAEYAIHQMRLMEDSHRKLVEEVLSAFCRMPVRIKAEIIEGASGLQGSSPPDFPGYYEESGTKEVEREAEFREDDINCTGSAQQEPEETPEVKYAEEAERKEAGRENNEKGKAAPGAEDALEIFEGEFVDPE